MSNLNIFKTNSISGYGSGSCFSVFSLVSSDLTDLELLTSRAVLY